MIYLAIALLVLLLLQMAQLLYARWQIPVLAEHAPCSPSPPGEGLEGKAADEAASPSGPWPKVSIIIPARDEEADIQQALQSVLHLDYPAYEIIVVNDRSRDGTGAILERLQADYPHLRVLTIDLLPPGWLGKNHALHQGAALATGELLLFTDADVVFSPRCLQNAVAVLLADQLDHLTLAPAVRSPSLGVNLLVCLFTRNFTIFAKPWRARNPRSSSFIGLGAFNLVRRAPYVAVGGHETIRLRPDDDMKLGKILKQARFRQDLRMAPEQLTVAWYGDVPSMVRGLEKNVLAAFDYQVVFLCLALLFLLALEVGPWLLAALGDPPVNLLGLAAGGLALANFALFLPQTGIARLWVLVEPLVGVFMVYILARSVFLTLKRGGILWRDTFYPLAELKQNQV